MHLLKDGGEQKKEDYAAINPLKVVPTLQIDGHNLFESAAIIEYLEETRPSHPLLPKDPYQRHLVRQITLIIVADIQPKQNLSVMAKYSADPAARNEWAKYWIAEGFEGPFSSFHPWIVPCHSQCLLDQLLRKCSRARRASTALVMQSPWPTASWSRRSTTLVVTT